MKLDRFAFGRSFAGLGGLAATLATLALASACSSSTVSPARTASAAPLSAEAASIPGTTNLMSAQLAGPAPKVGKAHLAVDSDARDAADDIETGSTVDSDSPDSPKEARRSDGSRRGGGFGSSK
jgi:hypothetical protein